MKTQCWLCGEEFIISEEYKDSKDLEHRTCETCSDEKTFFLYENEEEFFKSLEQEKVANLIEEDMEYWRKAQEYK